MTDPLALDAIEARYDAWYGTEDDCNARSADWSGRDPGETLSHYIVRNDVPDLVAELREARAKLAAADVFGTNLVIAVNDYSEKLQAIDALHQELLNDDEWSMGECAGCGGIEWPCATRKILDGASAQLREPPDPRGQR